MGFPFFFSQFESWEGIFLFSVLHLTPIPFSVIHQNQTATLKVELLIQSAGCSVSFPICFLPCVCLHNFGACLSFWMRRQCNQEGTWVGMAITSLPAFPATKTPFPLRAPVRDQTTENWNVPALVTRCKWLSRSVWEP